MSQMDGAAVAHAADEDRRTRESYEQWHKKLDVDKSLDTPWHQLLLATLDRSDVENRCILDIACGRGGLACRLVRTHPRHLVAADFSFEAVSKGQTFARANGLDTIAWQVADATRLPHPDEAFDTVISCETLEHLPDIRGALRGFARVLKPNGRLFLTTPNYLGPLGLYRGYMRARGRRFTEEGQPINRFLLLPLSVALVRQAGLEVTAVESVGHYVPWPGRVPIRLGRVDSLPLAKWFGHHTLIVATKPSVQHGYSPR